MAFLGIPGDFLFGSKEKTQEFNRYNPQQEQVMNMLLGGGQQQLPQAFDFIQMLLSQSPEAQQAFERPALRQFNEQIIPGIGERFTRDFGPGSQSSSAFGQQLGAAGAELAESLAAQRAGRGLEGIDKLISLLNGGLGQRTGRETIPGSPGLVQTIIPQLISQGGQAAKAYLGGF